MSYRQQYEADNVRLRLWDLQDRVERVTREPSAAERDALEAAQARFDSVGCYTGARASAPIPGESSLDYRKRLLAPLAAAHARFQNSRLGPLDSPSLAVVEDIVYADAVSAAKRDVPPGQLKAVQERDGAGRLITRYFGDPAAWMQHFMTPGAVGTINRNPPPKA